MALRCIQYFAEHNASRYEIIKLKERIPILLQAIEQHEYISTMYPGELMELCTIFINHLKIPDFLFSKLAERIHEVDIDKVKKKILETFISSLMDRHKEVYMYNFYNIDEFDYNNKWTKDTLEVLRHLLTKLSKSKYSSRILHAMTIASHPGILKDLVPKESVRKQLIEHLISCMNAILTRVSSSFKLDYVKETIKVMGNDKLEDKLGDSVNPFIERVNFAVRVFIQQSPDSPEVYEYLYYLLKAIDNCRDSDKSVLYVQKNQIATIFKDYVMPNIMSKCQTLVQEIMFDTEVKQQFNPNVYMSDYAETQYIPMIITLLDHKLEPRVKSNLTALFERTSKRWSGKLLLENMLFLQKHEV